MKILNKLTLKTMFKNKKRTFLTLIGITLSSLLLFSVALAGSTYRQNNILTAIDIYGDQHAIIYNMNIKDKEILDKNENVDKYFYLFEVGSTIFTTPEDSRIVSIYNYSPQLNLNIEGNIPNNENEIMFSRGDLSYIDKEINDEIVINDKIYKIVGFYQYSSKLSQISNNVAFTKSEEEGTKAIFFIYMKNYKDIYSKLYDIERSLNENLTLENLLDDAKVSENNPLLENYVIVPGNGAIIQAIIFLVLMFLMLIMAFVSLFVIYNAFAISVNERKKSYALYKSIGAEPKQIVKSVLFEAFLLTIIAIPLGFLLSLGFVSGILAMFNHLLDGIITHNYIVSIYPVYIIMAICYLMACVFIASFSPAKRAGEARIIDVIRQNTEINKKGALFKENKLIKKIFGIEGVISSKNSTRNYRKYNVTVFSIIIGCILFIVSSIFLNIVSYSQEMNYDGTKNIISVMLGQNEENLAKEIASLEETDIYMYYSESFGQFEFKEEDIFQSTVSHIVNEYSRTIYLDQNSYDEIKKEYNIQNDYPILIGYYDTSILTEYNIPIGRVESPFFNKDIISLKIVESIQDEEKIYSTEYDSVNVIKGYGSKLNNFYFTDNVIPTLLLPFESQDDIYLLLKSKEFKEIDSKILNIIKGSEYESYDNYYNEPLESSNDVQKFLAIKLVIYSAIIIIVIITATSIVNTISTNLDLRRREFAVLRSIGLDKKGFNKMILYESLMLSIKSLVFGILLSLAVLTIFLKLLSFDIIVLVELFYIFPTYYYILPFVICIIAVFTLVFTCFYMATRKYKKDNIADVLKEDSY